MKMFLFTVTDTLYSETIGLILFPGIRDNPVPIGTPVSILRPDKSEIETKITSITFEPNLSVGVEKSIGKKDVPVGSQVWVKKFIIYDLKYYILTSKRAIGVDFEIIFQHKVKSDYFSRLLLSKVAGIKDNITSPQCSKLRIDMTARSYATDLAIQLKNDDIKTFPEALLFTDDKCTGVCFRGVAESIVFKPDIALSQG